MKISKYKKEFIEKEKSSKHVKMIKIINGKKAFDIAKYVFFEIKNENPDEWSKIWNDYEKNTCALVIYEYKSIINKSIIFKLIIGRDNTKNFSIVAEKYSYNVGKKLLNDIL